MKDLPSEELEAEFRKRMKEKISKLLLCYCPSFSTASYSFIPVQPNWSCDLIRQVFNLDIYPKGIQHWNFTGSDRTGHWRQKCRCRCPPPLPRSPPPWWGAGGVPGQLCPLVLLSPCHLALHWHRGSCWAGASPVLGHRKHQKAATRMRQICSSYLLW